MMYDIPDHLVIRNLERTGYPDGKEPAYPHCPVCNCETDTLYLNKALAIVGCDNCIATADAWEEPQCFPEKE